MSDEQQDMSKDSGTPENSNSPIPEDHVLQNLQASVQFVIDIDQNTDKTKPIIDSLQTFSQNLIPLPPSGPPNDDLCGNPSHLIQPACAQLKLSLAQAQNVFTGAASGAASTLHIAVSAWLFAITQYEFAKSSAQSALHQTLKPALETYKHTKNHPDSPSRALVLFYGLQTTSTAAIVTLEGSLATAAAALAGAAGTLLAAYVSYIAAIKAAAAIQMSSVTAAYETFWQTVETSRDS